MFDRFKSPDVFTNFWQLFISFQTIGEKNLDFQMLQYSHWKKKAHPILKIWGVLSLKEKLFIVWFQSCLVSNEMMKCLVFGFLYPLVDLTDYGTWCRPGHLYKKTCKTV
ncbi:hypothetical protein GOODEAATRI_013456 [Goodea atripinnis]|uniref:Uncharacterized protein n=1 Tax=Goodea atripinnis TaxID=208336 RepID=A0ABV0MJG9_9TELE